ncbi:UvrD-helicase domain-containing protein [Aquincola sp. S2]|uniref:DNA 3'-5' helicase n=1 Tax=Pseudaquabacterium terrae TaxID=2732868 RepID=A0ABX2EN10_9BURK|nr:UvrD-helicase domain-containing protein [Aquabacterium terrae]
MIAAAYRADGQPCSREAFYALACDPARSVVVEACAGAGKTWMLVSRILRALLDGVAPEQILAITFTRKAAGEMRERLQEWLTEFALADTPSRIDALRQRGVEAAQAEALAPALAGLAERLLASGRAVEILTFHAWFSRLMRAAPHELLQRLGLQPGMGLIEDITELQPELMRRFHAAVADDADALADYRALIERHGRARLAAWLAAALDKRIEIELADEAGRAELALPALDDDEATAVDRLADDMLLRHRLDDAARALGAHKGKRERDAGDGLQQALAESDPLATFETAWAALFTKEDKPRKLGDAPAVEDAFGLLLQLRDEIAQQNARRDHGRMLRLSRRLLLAWRDLKRERALADMADLERCALALLSDPVLSGWVQQRLDQRTRQVLIDEFQDTSPLQWQALLNWLSAYAGSGGGLSGQRPPAVFIVGDPKQSIYRFRRAEPRVFAAAREFVAQGLGGTVLECDHTRRNAPGVIEQLNRVFGDAEAAGEFSGFRSHTTEAAPVPLPALRVLPEAARPARERADRSQAPVWRDSLSERRVEPEVLLRRAEAAQVAAAIVECLDGGVAPDEIMVLARKRNVLALVADALRERHVPCVAPEDLLLAEVPEARDLIALLDVLASPGHDLSLAHALKSPVFAADDAELLALAQRARTNGGHWRAALADWTDAPAALARARDLLAGWAAVLPQLSPHDLLDRIVHEGDVLARLVAAAPPERRGIARQAVQALLAQALAIDGGRYATPYNFVRALRRRPVRIGTPAFSGAVRLLTVHGAKGLEADRVFLVDADPEPPNAGQAGLMVEWPVHEAAPSRIAFVASLSRCPPSLRRLADEEALLNAREDLNVLYVAMTRARYALVVSRTPPRASDPLAWWPRLLSAAEPWVPDLARQAHGAAALLTLPVLPAAAPEFAHAVAAASAVDETAARLGQAVHRVLEWAAQRAAGTRPRAELAAAAAQAFGLDATAGAEIERRAAEVLDAPALARFFDPAALRWAGNEVPVAHDGDPLRIDRLVQIEADGCWWVLDYKLASAPERLDDNRAQLRRYRDAIAALQPGDPVRAAFIAGGGRLVELSAEDTDSPTA